MFRTLARRGAPVLVATALLGGGALGMTAGVGTAAAQGSAGCGSTCSSDEKEASFTLEGFDITYQYPDKVAVGSPVTFTVTITDADHPDRQITRFVHNTPHSYELSDVTVSRVRPDGGRDVLALDRVADTTARTVTVTDPSGSTTVGGGLRYELTYLPKWGYSSHDAMDGEGSHGIAVEGPGYAPAVSPRYGTATGEFAGPSAAELLLGWLPGGAGSS
jgi:hypothetical protein